MHFIPTTPTKVMDSKTRGKLVLADKEFTIQTKDHKLSVLKPVIADDRHDEKVFTVTGLVGLKHGVGHEPATITMRLENQEDLKSLLWALAHSETDDRSKRRIAQRNLRKAFDPQHPSNDR